MKRVDTSDLSFSCWKDMQPRVATSKVGIYRRVKHRWVDNETVTECHSCRKEFTWYWNRYHHCRKCGNAVCSECSSHETRIPSIFPLPVPNNGEKPIGHNEPVRVCDECYDIIVKHNTRQKQYLIMRGGWKKMTLFLDFIRDVYDLKRISLVCRDYRDAVVPLLSRFREIQYKIPGQPFDELERELLWTNREYFVNHSRWMTQLIRSIPYKSTRGMVCVNEVCDLIEKHYNCDEEKNHPECWNLMCTRYCRSKFSINEFMCLFDEMTPCLEVQEKLIGHFDDCVSKAKPDEWYYFIPCLVHHMRNADCSIHESVIGKWLIRISRENPIVAKQVYWCFSLSTQSRNQNIAMFYSYWLEQWSRAMPAQTRKNILDSHQAATECVNILCKSNNVMSMMHWMQKAGTRFVSPVHPEEGPASIDLESVAVKDSITKPVMFTLKWDSQRSSTVLAKPEDVRKDYYGMSFIRAVDQILKRDLEEDYYITTYDVQPINLESGFIEIVEDSTTFCALLTDQRYKKNLFNFVSGEAQLEEIRMRFMKSCSAYTVITYLLGAGDRHQDNIMVTKEGVLFHIDYGYIMGADPKRKLPGMGSLPEMRIDQVMLEAMGSQDRFQEFRHHVDRVYNCLRRNVEPLTAILRLLALSEPQIPIRRNFNHDKLMDEVLKRFVPGENHEEARIHINRRIDNSTQSTAHFNVIDMFHNLTRSNSLVKGVASTWHSIKKAF